MKHLLRDRWSSLVPFVLLIFVFSPVRAQSLEQQGSTLSTTSLYQNLSIPVHLESNPVVEATGNAEPTLGKVSIDAQWDLQFEYAVSDSLGYFSNAGAFWTGSEFWVSKWNSDTLATLDATGSLIQIFTIPGITGVRSITSDGTNLFLGTANASITEVNPVTKTVVGTITITGAGAAIGSRFLTYDPTLNFGNGGFYIGNFTSNIAAVSMTGATLSTIPQTTHGRLGMYGAAYDGISIGGPYLWVFEQPTTPSNAIISQLQLPAGTWTGVSYDIDANLGLPGSLAGGLFIATNLVTGQNTIGGMAQGTPNTLFGLELDFQVINVDAQIANALPDPGLSFVPLSQAPNFNLTADISNFGQQALTAASLDVEVIDLETNSITYSGASSAVTINSTQSSSFSLGPWAPVDTGSYLVSLATNTGSQIDQVPSNDSAAFFITVTDSILGIDQGPSIGNFGVGAGTGQNAVLATKLTLPSADTLTSVTAFFGTPPSGQAVSYNVYSILTNGAPSVTPIATTISYTFTANDAANGVALTLPLAGGKIGLPAGDFFIGVVEVAQNIGLTVTGGLYQPGNIWFRANNIGGGAWQSATNAVVLAIRANFSNPIIPPTITFETDEITVPEDTGAFQVFVAITDPLVDSTNVQVNIGNFTAAPGTDFQVAVGNLIFPGGSSNSIGITITIIDDADLETPEFFELVLSNPSNGASISPFDTIRINIEDNDLNPTVQFVEASMVVQEDTGTVSVLVKIDNFNAFDTDVSIGILGSSTADGADYMLGTTSVTFLAGSSADQSVVVTIVDDLINEPLEFLELVLLNPTNNAVIGMNDTLIIEIVDNDLPNYAIATLTNDSNSDGLADSLTVSAEIRGIVYGVNLSTSGLQFTLIDSTDGIQIFSFNVVDNYVVTEGDSLHVWGTVGQFNGLAQFEPDSIQLISQGNPLKPASLQILLGEKDESRLIVINCVTLVDAAGWPADGDNANLEVRNGVDTFIVRIDKETNLDGSPAPTGWFNITGIGGQFDSSPPYMSGYQLFPRYVEDIESLPATVGGFALDMDQLDESTGSYSFDFSLKNGVPDTANISLRIGAASTATEITDFSLDTFSSDFVGCGDSASYAGMLTIVDDTDVEGDETIEIILEASIGGSIVVADTLSITITETDNILDGTSYLGISIYPNPGSQEVIISAEERILSVELLDMTGRVLAGKVPNTVEESFDTEALPSGVYSLRVETGKGVGTYRWIKR